MDGAAAAARRRGPAGRRRRLRGAGTVPAEDLAGGRGSGHAGRGGYLLLAWGAGLTGLAADPLAGTGGAAGLVALAGAVGAGWVSRLHHGFDSASRHPVLAGGALLVSAGTVVLALWRADESGLAVLRTAVAAAVVSGYLSAAGFHCPPTRSGSRSPSPSWSWCWLC